MIEEEILFPLQRTRTEGLVLLVKPSSLPPGLATRVLGDVGTGPWDSQPRDLQRLELPPELEKKTNLIAAMAPPGVRLYDLLPPNALGVVPGLGDAGGLFVRMRGSWCSVASAGAQVPFRLKELIALVRPLVG